MTADRGTDLDHRPTVTRGEARYRAAEAALWRAEGVQAEERWVELARHATRVRLQVVGQGPPVLFVHGVNNSGTSWAPLVARMPGFQCLLLDRPGCGLSPPLRQRFDDVAGFVPFAEALVVEVLDALGLGTAHVVSTSWGGYYALRAAARHPDRLGRLVHFGWTVGAPAEEMPWVMRLGGLPRLSALTTRMPVNDRMVRSMLARIGLRAALEGGRVSPEAIAWFRAQVNHTDTMRNDVRTGPPMMSLRRGITEAILLPDEVLSAISVPSLFLWGDDDVFGGGATARRFTARIPSARLELLPDAGHAPWLDDPDGAASATAEFLGEEPAP